MQTPKLWDRRMEDDDDVKMFPDHLKSDLERYMERFIQPTGRTRTAPQHTNRQPKGCHHPNTIGNVREAILASKNDRNFRN